MDRATAELLCPPGCRIKAACLPCPDLAATSSGMLFCKRDSIKNPAKVLRNWDRVDGRVYGSQELEEEGDTW
jgi:hypothetical protein